MATKKRLYLLDAYALIYRAYYALNRNPRINSKGLNTSAILGFANTLLEVLENEKPDYLAVVFDPRGKTFRSDFFPEYKANREKTPEDISLAVPYIKSLIEGFGIEIVEVENYEADDVIGTLAKKAEKEGFTTFMMTPDKDFAQLVSENIFMYRPGRGGNPAETWGIPEHQKRFDVEDPLQEIDILGLWGDAADNIPGIPGIGEKRAKDFVGRYGSVEGLIAHTDELKGKMKENVINFAQQGLDSKRLATIVLDVPIDFDADSLETPKPDSDKVQTLFEELEFRTLLKRIQKQAGVEVKTEVVVEKTFTQQGTIDMFAQLDEEVPGTSGITTLTELDKENTKYTIVESQTDINSLIEKLETKSKISIQIITNNENAHEAEIVAMAFSTEKYIVHFFQYPPTNQKVTGYIVNRLRFCIPRRLN